MARLRPLLRVIAVADFTLFRDILSFDAGRYPTDRATYHVSADVSRLPDFQTMGEADLPALLDALHVRQVVHVTFGSTLAQFYAPIFAVLRAHQNEYTQVIERHFIRHLAAFVAGTVHC